MPLHIISSNRIESLQGHLSLLVEETPLRDPFHAEQIVVPGMAMSRWLNLEFARSQGIAANYSYALPAAWIWGLASTLQTDADNEETDPFSREEAVWKIFPMLPELLQLPEFQALQQYLKEDESGVRRWQLAQRIADVFDRYQYYRPDWIRNWSRGLGLKGTGLPDEQCWQPLLWQKLLQAENRPHRVELIDQLQSALRTGELPEKLLQKLPERVSCFALSSLPPLFIEVFQSLAGRMEVFLFQHSPTDQYWADIRSKRELARMRVKNADAASYFDNGNELLASWGRQGKAFQDLLINSDDVESAQWEDYHNPGQSTLLHCLQKAIFHMDTGASLAIPADDSVKVSICHSPMRECQVLHDELLRMMQQDSTLKPEDILVMVPQISEYAPYIEAVFSHEEQESRPFIPWNLSDTTLADEHPLTGSFFRLLALPESRFPFSEVTALLEVPEIGNRFGLDRLAGDEITGLLKEARVHWGLDAEQKQELGLPGIVRNTWLQATERLMAGYALPEPAGTEESPLWQGLAMLPGIDGARAQQLGKFLALLDALKQWRKKLQGSRTAVEWQDLLNDLLAQFYLETGEEESRLQQIRDTVNQLKLQAGQTRISRSLLIACLQDELGTRQGRSRYFSGGVTFCGMRPMRSMPFRVICVPGMQDLAFPRREQHVEFDGMADQWRAGDVRKGDEDRYLLLETLLCAREKLYFSYTGRSTRDNTPCQPSILLQELLDFIDEHFHQDDAGKESMSSRISHVFPMQAFNPENYSQAGELSAVNSHDSYWCHIAQKLSEEPGLEVVDLALNRPVPEPGKTDEPGVKTHDLARLSRVLKDPLAGFFKYRLGIFLTEDDDSEDEEPFSLDGLGGWSIRQRILADFLSGEETLMSRLDAEGMLPHGFQGEVSLEQAWQSTQPLREQLHDYRNSGQLFESLALELPDGTRIVGRLRLQQGRGLLHVTPSKLKGKALLQLWLEHLALCASGNFSDQENSLLVTADCSLSFPAMAVGSALNQLQDYVSFYRECLQRPLPVYPDSSFAWMITLHETDDENRAQKAAFKAWFSQESYDNSGYVRGDEADAYVQLACRGQNEILVCSPEFQSLARRLYSQPLTVGRVL